MQDYIAKVKAALNEDGRTKAWRLRVWWNGSALVLEGRVSLYYHKQVAQHVVMRVGRVDIENQITVSNEGLVLT